jgi:phage terminase Nu1 subunit (DNA packaging protein)
LALKNAAARGELLDADAVEADWHNTLRQVRAGMLAVPSRAGARLPHLTTHDVAEIDAEVRAVLAETAISRHYGCRDTLDRDKEEGRSKSPNA